MKKNITEIAFTELGFFTGNQIKNLAEKLNGRTYMDFQIKNGSCAGNHTLIVQVEDRDESPEEIKNFFLAVALSELASA